MYGKRYYLSNFDMENLVAEWHSNVNESFDFSTETRAREYWEEILKKRLDVIFTSELVDF